MGNCLTSPIMVCQLVRGENSIQLGVRGDCLKELLAEICFLRVILHVLIFLQHKGPHYRERGMICIFDS